MFDNHFKDILIKASLISFVFATYVHAEEIKYTPIVIDDIIVTVPFTPSKPIPTPTMGRIKKTGKTKSYVKYDDAYYQKGIASKYSRAKEIVTDYITNLQWQDDDEVGNIAKPWLTSENYDAQDFYNTSGDTAATYCKNLTLGGHKDWRLPTIKELESTLEYGNSRAVIGRPIFKNGGGTNLYCSSTTYRQYENLHWVQSGDYGVTYETFKYAGCDIRCVRVGR